MYNYCSYGTCTCTCTCACACACFLPNILFQIDWSSLSYLAWLLQSMEGVAHSRPHTVITEYILLCTRWWEILLRYHVYIWQKWPWNKILQNPLIRMLSGRDFFKLLPDIVRQKNILLDIVWQRFSHFLPDNVQQKNFVGHCPAEIFNFFQTLSSRNNFAGHCLAKIFFFYFLPDNVQQKIILLAEIF